MTGKKKEGGGIQYIKRPRSLALFGAESEKEISCEDRPDPPKLQELHLSARPMGISLHIPRHFLGCGG